MPASPPRIKFVVCDLDGLLLDTETLCVEVANLVVSKYGKTLTAAAHKAALGKRPLDSWTAVISALGITEATAEQLLDESEVLLQPRFPTARMLPGAQRLVKHLHSHGVPLAVATSTSRATFTRKLQNKPELSALFKVVVCGDEVPNGKPAPDVFLEAARQLGADPKECLVLEDAPSGVEAAMAAGMHVVVVPSIVDRSEYPQPTSSTDGPGEVVQILSSLLDFQPQPLGLPPFHDLVNHIIPLDTVVRLKGEVVKGFGRGSKELGIPTANVDSAALRSCLAQAVTGIYAGWASIGTSTQVYKMVMSIGWNPFYGNKEKTAEPWILHHFDKPFYGEEIRLVVCGYVRPEQNFTSLQALIDRIHMDGEVSKVALDLPPLKQLEQDAFLQPESTAPK